MADSEPTLSTPLQTPGAPVDLVDVDVQSTPLGFSAPEVPVTGVNSALRRRPRVDAEPAALLGRPGFVPRWKPYWPKVKTIHVTFPDGMEFLPPAPEKETRELQRIAPPRPADEAAAPRKAPTRIRPPADALSLEDRLFYVLQPPLESWLKGQELIMPFEPFGYQYEGIAWLFSQKAALLADEMGLGKTMQTITALRLLLRSGQVHRLPEAADSELAARVQAVGRGTPCHHDRRGRPPPADDLAVARVPDPPRELRTRRAGFPGDDWGGVEGQGTRV